MIQGEVRRYLRDNNSIRVSRSLKDLAYRALKLKDQILVEKGSEPTNQELSEILGVSMYDLVNALDSLKDPVSIFEPIYSDGGDTIYLYDQLADNSLKSNDLDTKLSVGNAINDLEERERYILNQRFVIGKTQMEIASELGISQAQISRIEKSAINNLKNTLK